MCTLKNACILPPTRMGFSVDSTKETPAVVATAPLLVVVVVVVVETAGMLELTGLATLATSAFSLRSSTDVEDSVTVLRLLSKLVLETISVFVACLRNNHTTTMGYKARKQTTNKQTTNTQTLPSIESPASAVRYRWRF
jgi:hypothetical protein